MHSPLWNTAPAHHTRLLTVCSVCSVCSQRLVEGDGYAELLLKERLATTVAPRAVLGPVDFGFVTETDSQSSRLA